MLLYVVVNGSWGPRAEFVPGVAERLSGTLRALEEIDGSTFQRWHEAGNDIPSDPVVEPSVPAMAEYIERKNTGPDLDVMGYTTSLWARNPGAAYVSIAIHAGGTSRYAVSSVSLVFRSREIDETAEVIRRAPRILRLLAENWEIDAGQVYDKHQYRAVAERWDLANSDPRCGRAVYLSAGRAALAPEGLPAMYVRTAHGGLVIDLTLGGAVSPAIETILEANARLRAAGALDKLATPFDRATF
ncbi:Imm52 family immunity protein [Streptomyces sp. NPDC059071]|uniref:Imm52 family immunity protein n=1 Tax=Streptomyces sp. NPDC059071 TaxID=3346714 RepID=UPI0036C0FF47